MDKSEGGVNIGGEEVSVEGPVVGGNVTEMVMGDKNEITQATFVVAKSSNEILNYLEQLTPDEQEEEAEQLHSYLDMTMRQCSGITLAPLDQAAKERHYLTMQRIFINLDAGDK